MTPIFESFINETVVPENWKTLTTRFNVESWTLANQRMKIIGEIVEFHEAMENYDKMKTVKNFELLELELADIIISCCTLIRLQGSGRSFHFISVNHEKDPIGWVRFVCERSTNSLISSVAIYGARNGIDVEQVITRKLEYNKQRKDWN